MSPCCDLDLENSKPIFLHALQLMAMHHNTKFGKEKCSVIQKTPSGHWHFDTSLWPDLESSYYTQKITTPSGLRWCIIRPSLVAKESIVLQKWKKKKRHFDQMSPCSDLDVEDSKQLFFRMILWLMMLHHHTKFGNKMFCCSDDIIQTNIHRHFEPLLWPWPWTQ